jgi:hypothetical protein
VRGGIFDVIVAEHAEEPSVGPKDRRGIQLVGWSGLRPLPPPPEEARVRGRRHSRERDAQAIAHHYDVSNDFYRIVLGSTMTYSCALWCDDTATLDDAQTAKHELICAKLDLQPGMRLLDVGCGWGLCCTRPSTTAWRRWVTSHARRPRTRPRRLGPRWKRGGAPR